MKRKKKKTNRSVRTWIQLAAACLTNGYATGFLGAKIYKGNLKQFCVPGLNCYSCPGALGSCPIGALQAVLGDRKFRFSYYVFGVLIVFGCLLGRLVCGFLCPFGLVQDLLHKIPVRKRAVPEKLDRRLRALKYAVLVILVVILPLTATDALGTGSPYFCKWLCPAGTLEGGVPLLLGNEGLRQSIGGLFGWKLFVLLAVVLISVWIYRPFCKYLCPLGAFYSLFNRVGLYRMAVNEEKCTHCGQCEKACGMGVKVTKNINALECIRCGECARACPHGAIEKGFRGTTCRPEAPHEADAAASNQK